MFPRRCVCIALLAGCLAAAESGTVAPLFNLREQIRDLADDHLELHLKVAGVVPGGIDLTLGHSQGTWLPGPVAGFNKAGHRCRAGDDLTVAPGRIAGTVVVTINPDQWLPSDKQPHDVPVTLDLAIDKTGGDPRVWRVTGTATGNYLQNDGTVGEAYAGAVTGTAVRPVAPGSFNLGDWDNGLQLSLDLGTKRVNWNRFACTRYAFTTPQDWSGFAGLRLTVASKTPRTDAAVTVWVMEEDGSWYYCQDAIPLADAINTGISRFTDFTEAEWVCPGGHLDEDYTLDLTRVKEFAVGVVNPLGIGTVELTLTAIDTITRSTVAPPPAGVTVTAATLAVNGHGMVPAGLFGGYAPYLAAPYRPGCQREYHTAPGGGPTRPRNGESFMIDMWGDRTMAATLLTSKNWREQLTGAARSFAEKAKDDPASTVLEFWNEPYLDWAKGGGKANHYDPRLFDQSKAVEGGEVFSLNYGGVIPHYRWRQMPPTLKAQDAAGQIDDKRKVPDGAKVGDTFTATVEVKKKVDGKDQKVKEERTFTVVEVAGWKVYDETQFTYWSGKGNGFVYDEMAKVVGATLKEISPQSPYVVGWGFRWCEDRWAAWDLLYRPTIDNTIAWIDGCHEHHYQGDTTAMNGSYEVLTAYGMAKHGKWLYSYNTETNDLIDTPARGAVDTPEKAKAASHYKRLAYNMRDCLYAVRQSPDKHLSRTVIHNDQTPAATEIAYGLMSELRGRLVATASSDDDVWCIASIDGTDPRAKRPDDLKKLVVFVWNDHRQERAVDLVINAPTGTTLGAGRRESVTLDLTTFTAGVATEDLAAPGAAYQASLTIPARRVVKFSFVLAGTPADRAAIERKQFFAPEVLQPVGRGKPWTTTVAIPAAELAGAKRAWLRLVVESIAEDEAVVSVGGTPLGIPRAVTGSNVSRIREIPLDPAVLTTEVKLVFGVADGNFDGYLVDMASVVIEK
jgi:hypothetical protein